MSQTTTPPIEMGRGFAGQLAVSHDPKMVHTGKCAASAMPLGLLAVVDQANGDDAVKLPGATGDITNLAKGVVIHSHAQESLRNSPTAPAWPLNSAAPILSKGQVLVAAEDAVTEGDAVFVRHTAPFGAFRSDVDGGDATLLPGAKWRSTTTGAGLAVVELNLP